MITPERGTREYRLIALAVAFFLLGLIFFFYDQFTPRSASSAPAPDARSGQMVVASQPSGPSLAPDFASDPAPSRFRTFTYDATGMNGSSSLPVSTTCHDAYVTILVFPAAVDYRANLNRAIINEALPCHSGSPFNGAVFASDMVPAPFGNYYVITADQGTSGTWYNPR
jgi:hypothetical protein